MPALPNDYTAVTPYRKTVLRVDVGGYVLADPAFSIEREFTEIAKGKSAKKDHVRYMPGIGWTLESYQTKTEVLHEGSLADSSVYAPGVNAQGASLLSVFAVQRKLSDYPPMSGGGYAAGVRSSGDSFLQVRVPSGTTTPSKLTADQTAYPSPDTTSDNAPMDRVLVSDNPLLPNQHLSVRFSVPSHGQASTSCFMTVYFAGPAGFDTNWTGSGGYALKLLSSGEMILFERDADDSTWQLQKVMRHSGGFAGRSHMLTISTDAYWDDGWKGRAITFRVVASK